MFAPVQQNATTSATAGRSPSRRSRRNGESGCTQSACRANVPWTKTTSGRLGVRAVGQGSLQAQVELRRTRRQSTIPAIDPRTPSPPATSPPVNGAAIKRITSHSPRMIAVARSSHRPSLAEQARRRFDLEAGCTPGPSAVDSARASGSGIGLELASCGLVILWWHVVAGRTQPDPAAQRVIVGWMTATAAMRLRLSSAVSTFCGRSPHRHFGSATSRPRIHEPTTVGRKRRDHNGALTTEGSQRGAPRIVTWRWHRATPRAEPARARAIAA